MPLLLRGNTLTGDYIRKKVMKKYKLFLAVTALSLTGCDPMDDRLLFINNSAQNVHVDMVFFRDGIVSDLYHVPAGNRLIFAQDTQRLGMTTFWENEFEHGKPDSLLRVIVIPEGKLRYPDSFEHWQSLIDSGTFYINNYTYRQLQRKNWTIIFPDDGFKHRRERDLHSRTSHSFPQLPKNP